MAVLRGKGKDVVYMEVTTQNMALLHRMVSTKAQASEQVHYSGLDTSAPNTPAHEEVLDLDHSQRTPVKHKVSTEMDSSPTAARHFKATVPVA